MGICHEENHENRCEREKGGRYPRDPVGYPEGFKGKCQYSVIERRALKKGFPVQHRNGPVAGFSHFAAYFSHARFIRGPEPMIGYAKRKEWCNAEKKKYEIFQDS